MPIDTKDGQSGKIYPAWLRWPYTLFVAILVPVYWQGHGPSNFLWFSDIALFAVLISLWTGHRLPYSMMAIGVLPLEIVWTIDFLAGGSLVGLASYMFDPREPLHLRVFSLFHLFLPPIIIGMLIVGGYDRRALWAQTLLAWIVILLTFMLAAPEDNVNWVHGLSSDFDVIVPPWIYISIYMIVFPLAVILPVHVLLVRLLVHRSASTL